MDKSIWLFSNLEFSKKEFKAGDEIELQIMRTWKWDHQLYGKVEVNEKTLEDVKRNFDENVRKIDLAVDENHESMHKALWWFKKLTLKGKDALFATIELTKKWADLATEGAYKYFSPELVFEKKDEETGKTIKNLLVGGAFTNRPFFKAMSPLMANEEKAANDDQVTHEQYLFFNTTSMKKYLELLAQFSEKETLSADERASIVSAFGELPEEDKTDEVQAKQDEILAKPETKEETKDEASKKEDETKKSSKEEKKAETVKANEDVTIKMSELETLKSLAKQSAELIKRQKRTDLEAKVNGLSFSETNAVGIVLPKSQKEIVDFAMWLKDDQVEIFCEILEKLQSVSAKEIGAVWADSTDHKPEEIAFVMKTMQYSEEEAKEVLDASKK